MSLYSHIDELSGKHQALDTLIEQEMARPSVDAMKVTELKRRKLRLKEKIASLKGSGR